MKKLFQGIDMFCSAAGLMGAILMCCCILSNQDVTQGYCIWTLVNSAISFTAMWFRGSIYNEN